MGEAEISKEWKALAVLKNPEGTPCKLHYVAEKVIGKGTFGAVYRIRTKGNEILAMKIQMLDENFISRELELLKELNHPNIVRLRYYLHRSDPYNEKLYLIMDYVHVNLHRFIYTFRRRGKLIPLVLVRVTMFQVLRGLKYLHARQIAHRDVKPSNILIDVETNIVKLCDFGSAKKLSVGGKHIAYICSRNYRAPELVIGSTSYTTKVDNWSAGLILAEMLVLRPIFRGSSNLDHFTEIIRVLGTPSSKEMQAMDPNFPTGLPKKEPMAWADVLEQPTEPQAIVLISMLVRYDPNERIDTWQALATDFFAEIRSNKCRLPSGNKLPPLTDFTPEELTFSPNVKKLFDSN